MSFAVLFEEKVNALSKAISGLDSKKNDAWDQFSADLKKINADLNFDEIKEIYFNSFAIFWRSEEEIKIAKEKERENKLAEAKLEKERKAAALEKKKEESRRKKDEEAKKKEENRAKREEEKKKRDEIKKEKELEKEKKRKEKEAAKEAKEAKKESGEKKEKKEKKEKIQVEREPDMYDDEYDGISEWKFVTGNLKGQKLKIHKASKGVFDLVVGEYKLVGMLSKSNTLIELDEMDDRIKLWFHKRGAVVDGLVVESENEEDEIEEIQADEINFDDELVL
jgi:hypothetical protein